mgnify:CR=1 FL=1
MKLRVMRWSYSWFLSLIPLPISCSAFSNVSFSIFKRIKLTTFEYCFNSINSSISFRSSIVTPLYNTIIATTTDDFHKLYLFHGVYAEVVNKYESRLLQPTDTSPLFFANKDVIY